MKTPVGRCQVWEEVGSQLFWHEWRGVLAEHKETFGAEKAMLIGDGSSMGFDSAND